VSEAKTPEQQDKAYREEGPRALGRMYAEFFHGLREGGLDRREALTVTIAYLRAIVLDWQHDNQGDSPS
jgi:hypothetical protein